MAGQAQGQSDTIVEVRGLIYEYPGLRALDDVSFTLPNGSITALVGPNGAGKTTLLRCMAALETPFSGQVVLLGKDVHDAPRGSHRSMGYLSDFFGLYDELTVRQCLTYRAAALRLDVASRESMISRAAGQLEIDDRLDQKAGSLSRGLRQRLAIAQAIIHQPSLLLLDEPASGLDPEARATLSQLLKALQQNGMTLVVSSHILAELADYATHMLVLRGGRVAEMRPLTEAAGAPRGKVQVSISLAREDERLFDLLVGREGVSELKCDLLRASFTMLGDLQAQHLLLKSLLDSGLQVATFNVGRENLQDAYLTLVRREAKR